MKKMLFGTVCAATFGMTGCASTDVSDLHSYEDMPIAEAPLMPPAAAMQSGAQEVVVFDMEEEASKAQDYGLARVITADLENMIADAGATIVDRDAATRLGEEVERAEIEGNASYQGPSVADTAIGGRINAVSVSYDFREPRRADDGSRIPGQCRYQANVSADLRVYDIPSLDVGETIRVSGSSRSSSEASSSRQCGNVNAAGLARSAAADAISSERDLIQNLFSPEGYVSGYLFSPGQDDHLIRTSLGKDLGAQEGFDVEIVRMQEREDRLSGETVVESHVIAEGVMTNAIQNGSSLVRIDDQDEAEAVKLGDTVRQLYQTSFFEQLIN